MYANNSEEELRNPDKYYIRLILTDLSVLPRLVLLVIFMHIDQAFKYEKDASPLVNLASSLLMLCLIPVMLLGVALFFTVNTMVSLAKRKWHHDWRISCYQMSKSAITDAHHEFMRKLITWSVT